MTLIEKYLLYKNKKRNYSFSNEAQNDNDLALISFPKNEEQEKYSKFYNNIYQVAGKK